MFFNSTHTWQMVTTNIARETERERGSSGNGYTSQIFAQVAYVFTNRYPRIAEITVTNVIVWLTYNKSYLSTQKLRSLIFTSDVITVGRRGPRVDVISSRKIGRDAIVKGTSSKRRLISGKINNLRTEQLSFSLSISLCNACPLSFFVFHRSTKFRPNFIIKLIFSKFYEVLR